MKNIILSIAGGSILLASIAIAGEALIQQTKAIEEGKNATIAAIEDPAITLITNEIITPLNQQSNKQNRFSRSLRTTNLNYNLVEVYEDSKKGERLFNITVTETSSFISKSNIKNTEKKPTAKLAHQVKYFNKANKVLIKQGTEWVAKQDHKYFKLLPKTVKSNKVIANKGN